MAGKRPKPKSQRPRPNLCEPERLLAKHTASKTSQPKKATFLQTVHSLNEKIEKIQSGQLRLRRGEPLIDFNVRNNPKMLFEP